jgi:GTP-binding protein
MTAPTRIRLSNPRFAGGAARPDQFPAWPRLEIAFGGRSNVGKSSLLRSLLGSRRLVRVSRTPGRTREVNFFSLRLDDVRCAFVDLPGYGYARVPRHLKQLWGKTVEQYVQQRDLLVAFVLLLDARRTPGDEERLLLQVLTHRNCPCLPVYTKVDKLPKNRLQHTLGRHQQALKLTSKPLGFSALTGEGREAVLHRLRGLLRRALPEEPAPLPPEPTGAPPAPAGNGDQGGA